MTDNEKLIASAKDAIANYDIAKAHRVSVAPDRLAVILAEMVAVFEKAHTPTDDEREALIVEWANVHQGPNAHVVLLEMLPIGDQMSLALRDALRELAALRRTEVSEPSAEAEPSGAIYDAFGTVVTRADTAFELGRRAERTESQGEPTAAQVEAAAVAIAGLDNLNSFHLEKARAALRAAGGAR